MNSLFCKKLEPSPEEFSFALFAASRESLSTIDELSLPSTELL